MKIAIIGAGAMGNLYGAYLSRNNEVYMIDINQLTIDSINGNGLMIYEKNTQQTEQYHVEAFTNSSHLGAMDLVIFFVKNIYNISALKNNLSLFGQHTLVMSLQNGAGNDKDLAQYIKKENIIIGTTEHNCTNLGLGRISHNISGITNIGMVVYNENIVGAVAELFENSGIQTNINENIQKIIWSKLFINMSLNSTTAILNCKVGYLHESKDATEIIRNILSEAVDVAIADGTYFNKEAVIEKVETHIREDFSEAITSMNQDVSNKRLTEIDHINGAVVRAAKEYGISTPYNDFIVHLIHSLEGLYHMDEQQGA